MAIRHSLEAFDIPSVKDERLPTNIPGFPLSPEELTELLEQVPIITLDPADRTFKAIDLDVDGMLSFNGETDGLSPTEYVLGRPGNMHKRSFVLEDERLRQPWQDEYGNWYRAITLKGNNFASPRIIESDTATEGHIAWGLQESMIIERVIKASNVLRSLNISTEYIVGLAEPKAYPWPLARNVVRGMEDGVIKTLHLFNKADAHEMVSLQEYKRRIIMEYWSSRPWGKNTDELLQELIRKFHDTTFYVSARAMDTELRLNDLQGEKQRQKIFDEINKLREADAQLDPQKPEDFERYLCEIFMPALGVNFARLHHAGLAHRFAHGGNLTAYGGIVDLDSVHGEPLGLGDDPITSADKAGDIRTLLASIYQIVGWSFKDADINTRPFAQFISSYFNETAKLAGDHDKAKKELGDTLLALQNSEKRSNDSKQPLPSAMWYASGLYCQRYLNIDLKEVHAEFEQLLENIGTQLDDTENYHKLKQILIEKIGMSNDRIIKALEVEISNGYEDGNEIDIAELFINSKAAEKLRTEMAEAIAQPIVVELLEKYFKEKFLDQGFFNESDSIIIAWNFMEALRKSHGVVTDEFKNLLNERLFNDVKSDINEKLEYKIPDTLLRTHDDSGLRWAETRDKKFWIITDNVPVDQLEQRMKSVSVITQVQPLSFDNKSFAWGVRADEGHHTTQMITDGDVKLIVKPEDDPDAIDLQFSEGTKPSYIIVAEENNEVEGKKGGVCIFIDERGGVASFLEELMRSHEASVQQAMF